MVTKFRNAIWHHWTRPSLVQIMAWHLLVPSHYLYQCWLIFIWTLRNKSQSNFKSVYVNFIQINAFQTAVCKMVAILFRPQCVISFYRCCCTYYKIPGDEGIPEWGNSLLMREFLDEGIPSRWGNSWMREFPPAPLFTTTPSYVHRDSHYKPGTVDRPSEVYNGDSYTCKTAYF